MKKNIKLFIGVCFFCGIFAFIGSILGNAFGRTGLFTGAVIGGCTGIVLSCFLFTRLKVIRYNSIIPVMAWGIVSFGAATLFAVTNLNTPVGPLLSILFVGCGCIIGNSIILTKGNKRQFYFSLIGFILIVPTLYFVIGSLTKYNLGYLQSFTLLNWMELHSPIVQTFNSFSPLVFLGCPLIAILLNIPAELKRGIRIATLQLINTRLTIANLTVAITGIVLLFTLTVYIFLENI